MLGAALQQKIIILVHEKSLFIWQNGKFGWFHQSGEGNLISPRRWGKSSLVKRVAKEVASKKLRIVEMDLLGIRDEEEFYKLLATETIKATGNKVEEWLHACKQFFKQITPRIGMGPDLLQDFEISFEWQDLERNYKEILNLPEKIAVEKNLNIIICIDEFQNMGIFRDPLLFQKRLRSEWQHQQRWAGR